MKVKAWILRGCAWLREPWSSRARVGILWGVAACFLAWRLITGSSLSRGDMVYWSVMLVIMILVGARYSKRGIDRSAVVDLASMWSVVLAVGGIAVSVIGAMVALGVCVGASFVTASWGQPRIDRPTATAG